MAITNYTTPDAAQNALANTVAARGITPSSKLSANQMEASVLANMLNGQIGGAELATGPGAGITGGTGTICRTSVVKEGGFFKTTIVVDLTGLDSSATDLDIIGHDAATDLPAYIGRITAAESGTIIGGTITCLEVPAGGVTSIDWYAAESALGVFDGGIAALTGTETVMHTATGASTLGLVVPVVADSVAANSYIYVVAGATTAGEYSAGRFRVELIGV